MERLLATVACLYIHLVSNLLWLDEQAAHGASLGLHLLTAKN